MKGRRNVMLHFLFMANIKTVANPTDERDCKRDFNWLSMQGWYIPINNGAFRNQFFKFNKLIMFHISFPWFLYKSEFLWEESIWKLSDMKIFKPRKATSSSTGLIRSLHEMMRVTWNYACSPLGRFNGEGRFLSSFELF